MKHKLLYLPLLCLLLLAGCRDDWDKHYLLDDESGQDNASASIWQYISENPDFAAFTALAKETGVDSVLTKDQQMTLWLPDEGTLAGLAALSVAEKRNVLENHINYVAMKSNRFADGQQVKTFARKNVYLNGTYGMWTIDGYPVRPDVANCSNGVVHEIGGLMTPRKNIFEYIEQLGDEYSTVRDTILSSCVKTFRPDLSFPLDVDEVGNTVYDSVFVYESKLLAPGDIRDENENFTFFLPDNGKIREIYEEICSYYPELTDKDSLLINNWIFHSLIYEGKIEDYTQKKSIRSTFNTEWRTDIQKVDINGRQEFSNGYIYPVEYFRLPHFMFLKTVETYPVYYKELSEQQADLINEYFKVETSQPERIAPNSDPDNKKERFFGVYDDNLTGNKVMALEWTSINKDRFGNVQAVPLVPGRYKLKFNDRSYGCGNARIMVNGVLPVNAGGADIPYFNMGDSKFDRKDAEIGFITIPQSAGVNPVRIRIECGPSVSNPFSKRIVVAKVVLEPDGDNY